MYVGFGVASPFFPAFLSSRGASSEQIGLLLSVSAIVRLVAGPLAGRAADRLHALRRVLSACALGSAVFALTFLPIPTFSMLLVIALFYAAALAPTTTLADALALRSATPDAGARPRFEYGWVRGAGSAAFIVGSLISGQVLNAFPPASALVGQAMCLVCASGLALFVAEGRPAREPSGREARSTLEALLTDGSFVLLVLVAALILGSHAMHDAFAMIAWTTAGIRPGAGSIFWSEQVAAEVVVFFFVGPALLRYLGPLPAMVVSALAAILRWTVLGQTTSALALALVEPLHGLTFALLHLACMRILVRVTPAELAATAQAFYALGIGAASALLTFASGFLYGSLGRAGFFVMVALAALSLPAIWALSRALRASTGPVRPGSFET